MSKKSLVREQSSCSRLCSAWDDGEREGSCDKSAAGYAVYEADELQEACLCAHVGMWVWVGELPLLSVRVTDS